VLVGTGRQHRAGRTLSAMTPATLTTPQYHPARYLGFGFFCGFFAAPHSLHYTPYMQRAYTKVKCAPPVDNQFLSRPENMPHCWSRSLNHTEFLEILCHCCVSASHRMTQAPWVYSRHNINIILLVLPTCMSPLLLLLPLLNGKRCSGTLPSRYSRV